MKNKAGLEYLIDKLKQEFYFWKRDKFTIDEVIRNISGLIAVSEEKAEHYLSQLLAKPMPSAKKRQLNIWRD